MDRGKEKCEILKAIRTYVAEKYGLEYATTECSHKGDCPGTCPKCDAELADLQRQLEEQGITDISQDKALSDMVENYFNTIRQDEDEQRPLGGEPALPDDIFRTEGMPEPPTHLEGDISMLSIIPEPKYERKVILECPVAGIGFHDINDIWDELYLGAKLALVREPKNKYDRNAVAVALADDYDENAPEDFDFDFILGYIPRNNNAAIAAMLDMGWQEMLEAEITELKDHAPYSDKLHITVYIRSKNVPIKSSLKERQRKIKAMICDDDTITVAIIAKTINVTPRTISRDLKQMGIRWEGHTKTGHWILYKQS